MDENNDFITVLGCIDSYANNLLEYFDFIANAYPYMESGNGDRRKASPRHNMNSKTKSTPLKVNTIKRG